MLVFAIPQHGCRPPPGVARSYLRTYLRARAADVKPVAYLAFAALALVNQRASTCRQINFLALFVSLGS